MLCEVCENADATVHLTDVSNNVKKEVHLCENCAQKRGTTIKSHMNTDTPPLDIKAANLVSADPGESAGEESDLACPTCGLSYRKFRSSGKFGCPGCYTGFGRHVMQLLEKIHNKVQHAGKTPRQPGRQMTGEKEVKDLRDDLRSAIEAEEYERAAQIRDQIYDLEGRTETRKG